VEKQAGNNCLPLFSLEQLEQLAEEKQKQLLETISQQKIQIAASRKEEEQLRQLLDSMQGSSSLEEEKHLRQHRDLTWTFIKKKTHTVKIQRSVDWRENTLRWTFSLE
jgi:hypothetical protein